MKMDNENNEYIEDSHLNANFFEKNVSVTLLPSQWCTRETVLNGMYPENRYWTNFLNAVFTTNMYDESNSSDKSTFNIIKRYKSHILWLFKRKFL